MANKLFRYYLFVITMIIAIIIINKTIKKHYYEIDKQFQNFYWLLAKKLLPRRLVHYCFVIVATYSSVTKYSNKELGTITILEANQVWVDEFLRKGK